LSLIAMLLASACTVRGCAEESVLMVPASCQEPLYSRHMDFYDDRHFAWERACPDRTQSGVLRIGAVLPTDALGCTTADGPCDPCVPSLQGECARTVAGLSGTHLVASGDRPHAAGYFLSCADRSPQVLFFFQDQADGPLTRCTSDATGQTSCQDECRLSFGVHAPAP
jgi:hypothetical protein